MRASQTFGGHLHEVRPHLLRSPDLGWRKATKDAGHLYLLARGDYVWRGYGGCDEVGAKHPGLASLGRARDRSDPDQETFPFERVDERPCVSDGGERQFHRLHASLGQRSDRAQKVLLAKSLDGSY